MTRLLSTLAACGIVLASVACSTATDKSTPGTGQQLLAAPDHARQGDTITLTGHNWRPNSQVVLAFDASGKSDNGAASASSATNLGNARVDAQGSFTFVSVVPQAAVPGTQTISAHGDQSQSATASFTVLGGGGIAAGAEQTLTSSGAGGAAPYANPTITDIAPTATSAPATETPAPTSTPPQDASLQAVWRGDKLELSGSGWPPNAQVNVSVSKDKNGKDPVPLGVLGTDGQGRFDVSTTVPKNVRGTWYVILQDPTHRLITPINKAGD